MLHERTRPQLVEDAHSRAMELKFELSCEPTVGRLLASLAASVPRDGRILELGTGAGVGLAWLVHGLVSRTDATVISVELDGPTHEHVAKANWPAFVQIIRGDGAELVEQLGEFDLIFSDSPGGKLTNLDGAIGALRPSGILMVDDMDLSQHQDDVQLCHDLVKVRHRLINDSRLMSVELNDSSGIILATRLTES